MKLHDLIIEILSKQKQLRAKVIFEEIKIQKPLTYQAIHKELNKMVKKNILCKEKQQYSINLEYVSKNKKKWEEIEKRFMEF